MNTAVAGDRALPALQPGPVPESPTGGELLRLLAAFAALGAGLTFFALSADVLLTADGVAATALGVATGVWAVAHTVWGMLAMRAGPAGSRAAGVLARAVPIALPAAAAVVLGSLVWSALLAPAGSRELNLTLVSALALILLQLGCQGSLRRQAGTGAGTSPGRVLAGLFFSAVLVAGITTPGLAASTAGDNAVPHGEHGSAPVPAPTDHADH